MPQVEKVVDYLYAIQIDSNQFYQNFQNCAFDVEFTAVLNIDATINDSNDTSHNFGCEKVVQNSLNNEVYYNISIDLSKSILLYIRQIIDVILVHIKSESHILITGDYGFIILIGYLITIKNFSLSQSQSCLRQIYPRTIINDEKFQQIILYENELFSLPYHPALEFITSVDASLPISDIVRELFSCQFDKYLTFTRLSNRIQFAKEFSGDFFLWPLPKFGLLLHQTNGFKLDSLIPIQIQLGTYKNELDYSNHTEIIRSVITSTQLMSTLQYIGFKVVIDQSNNPSAATDNQVITILLDPYLRIEPQGYILQIIETKLCLMSSDTSGILYGIQTLLKIVKYHSVVNTTTDQTSIQLTIPNLIIYDFPDVINRAVLWPIHKTLQLLEYNDGDVNEIEFLARQRVNSVFLLVDNIKQKSVTDSSPPYGIIPKTSLQTIEMNFQKFGLHEVEPFVIISSLIERLSVAQLKAFTSQSITILFLFEFDAIIPECQSLHAPLKIEVFEDNLSDENVSLVQKIVTQSIEKILEDLKDCSFVSINVAASKWLKTEIINPTLIAQQMGFNVTERESSKFYTRILSWKPLLCTEDYTQSIRNYFKFVQKKKFTVSVLPWISKVAHESHFPRLLIRYHYFVYFGFAWNMTRTDTFLQYFTQSIPQTISSLPGDPANDANSLSWMVTYSIALSPLSHIDGFTSLFQTYLNDATVSNKTVFSIEVKKISTDEKSSAFWNQLTSVVSLFLSNKLVNDVINEKNSVESSSNELNISLSQSIRGVGSKLSVGENKSEEMSRIDSRLDYRMIAEAERRLVQLIDTTSAHWVDSITCSIPNIVEVEVLLSLYGKVLKSLIFNQVLLPSSDTDYLVYSILNQDVNEFYSFIRQVHTICMVIQSTYKMCVETYVHSMTSLKEHSSFDKPTRKHKVETPSHHFEAALMTSVSSTRKHFTFEDFKTSPSDVNLVHLHDAHLNQHPIAPFSTEDQSGKKSRVNKSQGKRIAVYESTDPSLPYSPKLISKSSEIRNLLLKVVRMNMLFQNCGEEDRNAIVDAFEPINVLNGDVIIKQGDSNAEYFYVIESGSVDVYIETFRVAAASTPPSHQASGTGLVDRFAAALSTIRIKEKVSQANIADVFDNSSHDTAPEVHPLLNSRVIKLSRSLTTGDYFGELALMYNTPRAASVVASEDCVIWRIDRQTYRSIVTYHNKKVAEGLVSLIRSVEILGKKLGDTLSEGEVNKLVASLEMERYENDTVIVRQAQAGDYFYVILEGTVDVWSQSFDTETNKLITLKGEKLATLGRGDYFGEKALLEDDVRQASCIASGNVTCLSLSRDDFIYMIGSWQEVSSASASVRALKKQERRLSQISRTDVKLAFSLEMDLEHLDILSVLGVGAFGKVKLARHHISQEYYALKCQAKVFLIQNSMQNAVLNEMRIMRMINHPGIARLYSALQDDKYIYFVLELLPGGELFNYLKVTGKVDEEKARFYTASVVSAFQELHGKKIAYRDLKPENLVFDARGYLKLVDLGLAKQILSGTTWTMCGTPDYLAPEIVLNKGHDLAVDYWALGIMTFEMIHGWSPFHHEQPMKAYHKIVKAKVSYPDVFSDSLSDLIGKLLQKNPSKRLGNTRGGIADILKHKWFGAFDWNALENGTFPPPYVPTVPEYSEEMDIQRKSHGNEEIVESSDWFADLN